MAGDLFPAGRNRYFKILENLIPMQNILLKQVKVVHPQSAWNGKTVDILIENGTIAQIDQSITDKNAKIIDGKGLHVSPGFFDPTVHFCDPGEEHKEDLRSGLKAAAAGGFTTVGVLGITNPAVTEKTRVEYLRNKAAGTAVTIVPAGCVSAKHEGRELAEMYDMYQSGARLFYDGKKQLNTGLLSRALDYGKTFNATVLSYPDDIQLTGNGLMHEGTQNIQLGLKGIPGISEELGIIRDAFLAEYHNAHVHIANVSCEGGVKQVKKAKASKINITAQCSIHHLFFTDEDLQGFDSNLKIHPPLRSQKDRNALIDALLDGTIDNITSDHTPQDVEAKKMEFDLAEYGAAGIETCFAALQTVAGKKLGLEKIVEILSIRSRRIIGLNCPEIEKGKPAELVLYYPDEDFTLVKANQKSKAWNNPYLDKKLKGRILAIINNSMLSMAD